MVQSDTAQAGLGLRSPDSKDLPEDAFILPAWAISGMLLATGLGITAGLGGFLAGLGLSGLFFFLGVVIEAAAKRNRR